MPPKIEFEFFSCDLEEPHSLTLPNVLYFLPHEVAGHKFQLARLPFHRSVLRLLTFTLDAFLKSRVYIYIYFCLGDEIAMKLRPSAHRPPDSNNNNGAVSDADSLQTDLDSISLDSSASSRLARTAWNPTTLTLKSDLGRPTSSLRR